MLNMGPALRKAALEGARRAKKNRDIDVKARKLALMGSCRRIQQVGGGIHFDPWKLKAPAWCLRTKVVLACEVVAGDELVVEDEVEADERICSSLHCVFVLRLVLYQQVAHEESMPQELVHRAQLLRLSLREPLPTQVGEAEGGFRLALEHMREHAVFHPRIRWDETRETKPECDQSRAQLIPFGSVEMGCLEAKHLMGI